MKLEKRDQFMYLISINLVNELIESNLISKEEYENIKASLRKYYEITAIVSLLTW